MIPVTDISDVIPYSEQHDRQRMPAPNDFIIERHMPELFDTPFHHHTSVELNFLENCEMTYSFSGAPAELRDGDLLVFWGAQPHRVTRVQGRGQITNIYLSLGQFLRWGLPDKFVQSVLSGAVVSANPNTLRDDELFQRLWTERDRRDGLWRRTHLDEIATRLRRLGLEGWDVRLAPQSANAILSVDPLSMQRVERILRFIAENFSRPLSISDISNDVNLSPSRATRLFRDVMGGSIKQHLTRTRLSHARMLLTETNAKIISISNDSGFHSLSSFYTAFAEANGVTPAQYRRDARCV